MGKMIFDVSKDIILFQLKMQLKAFFLINDEEEKDISDCFENALAACEENFSYSPNKYYFVEIGGGKNVRFNPYHSVQYMIFLYYLSHLIYLNNSVKNLADKIYYLNKIFHSVDLFYAIELPKHFGAEHPLGSVRKSKIW